MKYLLIHGYGVGLQYSFFKQAEGVNAGFGAFDELIEQKQASVFRWDIPRKLNLFESINPIINLRHYRKEVTKAQDKATHQALEQELDTQQPEIIVCHSTGSLLLYSYLQEYILPQSVKRIVFIQSNIPRTMSTPQYLENALNNKSITMINMYCCWDQALCSLVLLEGSISLGLCGSRHPLPQFCNWANWFFCHRHWERASCIAQKQSKTPFGFSRVPLGYT